MTTLGLQYSSPELLLFARFLVGTIFAFIFFFKTFKKLLRFEILLIGILNAVPYFLQNIGQVYVPAGQSAILLNFYSIIVPLFAYVLLKDVITKKIIGGVIIGFTGVILIVYKNDNLNSIEFSSYLFGVLNILLAGIIWALYVVLAKKYNSSSDDIHVEDIFVASMFYSATLGLIVSNISILKIQITFEFLLSSIYLGFFCSFLAFTLYLQSLKNLKVTSVSIILLSQVPIAFTISVFFLDETIVFRQIVGVFIILFCIIFVVKEEESIQEKIL